MLLALSKLFDRSQKVHKMLVSLLLAVLSFDCNKTPLHGPPLNIKTIFPGIGIPMLKIRGSKDRLIFNMGIPLPARRYCYIELAR